MFDGGWWREWVLASGHDSIAKRAGRDNKHLTHGSLNVDKVMEPLRSGSIVG